MRTILTSIILLACSLSGLSQLPTWKIKPNNDTLLVMEGTSMIRGDKKGKITLWDMNGQQLFTTDERITKFYEGLATVLKKESLEIIGVIDTDGKYISMPHLGVAYNHPHFENGYLIAKRKGKFAMYTKDGKEQSLPDLATIYPFSKGYAVYLAYENPEKLKKPFYNYIKPDGNPLERFILKEKDKEKIIEPKNVKFLSSINSDGKSIAILKNKLYWFDASDESLTPILMGDESEKKRHLTLASDKDQDFTTISDGNLKIQAKYGKDQLEEYEFDNRLRLISGGKKINDKKVSAVNQLNNMETNLDLYQENGVYGLILNGKDSIPCQFEQVGLKYGNNAFVKIKDKWGVLELIPDMKFDINLNNGEVIPFRHQKFPTKLHIDLPCSIPSKGIRTDIAEIAGCSIDLSSKENRDTKNGNYIAYDCILMVPSNLTDTISNITYGPLELIHDNVRMHAIPVYAKGQYLKPYTIEIEKKELSVINNQTDFNIIVNINKEEDEEDYPYSVNLESESLQTRCEKVSDNNYKCFVEYVEDGTYNLDLILTETGCPSCIFPLEINCNKKGKATVGIILPDEQIENDSTAISNKEDKTDLKKKDISGKKNSRSTAASSKTPLFIKYDNGYLVAEVTAQDVVLSSGPGNDFPAPTYTIENVGQKEIPIPYKGQLIKVKDEGEWYLRYPSVPTSQSPQPEYISKKNAKAIRSTPFILDEITEPCTYISYHEIYDEANNKGQYIDEIVAYPGGVCIEYCEGKMGSMIKFGNIEDGKPAIKWKYRIQTRDGGEVPEGSKSNVSIDNNKSMHRLRLTIAPQDKKIYDSGKGEINYIGLSSISADEWTDVLKDYLLTADLKYDKHEVSDHECDVLTKDMLEKNYTKVNK